MKRYIKILIFILGLSSVIPSFAAGALDHFEVILGKESARVGDALDITISAVDKNNEILTDYTGDILVFSESDKEAEFPNDLAENSYSFTKENEGSVKFENAVRFKNPGRQDVYVYDLNDENVLGVAEVMISAKEAVANLDIEILSPENGITIGKNTLKVSGSTQKNYQVRIVINKKQDIFTTSNNDGIFEKEVENLQQGENTIQAFVLDADNKVVGESDILSIKIDSSLPTFKSITITPEGDVEAESEISIEVISNKGLTSVTAIIDDVITNLKEEKNGVYTAKTRAPKTPGKYGVDVVLKDEFAHEAREANAATLTVIAAPELNAGGEEPKEEKIIETISTPKKPAVLEELNLSITGIQLTELKTKSILTWDKVADAESYNIYKKISATQVELIENIKEARYEIEIVGDEIKYDDFAIKAVGRTSTGVVVSGDLSEMTKVQTGPELYFLLFILALSLSGGIFYLSSTRKNAY